MNQILKQRLNTVLIVAATLCMTACVGGVSFPKPPGPDVDRTKFTEVSAIACGYHLIHVLPLGTTGRQERAYTELVELAKGNYVGDIEMTEHWYYGIIGSLYCTSLKAKAYARLDPVAVSPAVPAPQAAP
jgi:hypothetical protein